MTEKRFEYWKDSDTAYDTKIQYGQYFRILDKKEMVGYLNHFYEENNHLKKERLSWVKSQEELECLNEENKQLKEKLSVQGVRLDFLVAENMQLGEVLNKNKELQERNNRQAQTIDELWSLIKANDWTKLKEMVEEDKKNEELLHMEFKCYEGE